MVKINNINFFLYISGEDPIKDTVLEKCSWIYSKFNLHILRSVIIIHRYFHFNIM